jgi:hypothetical protein
MRPISFGFDLRRAAGPWITQAGSIWLAPVTARLGVGGE